MADPQPPATAPPLDRGTHVGYAMGSLATGAFGTVPGLLLLFYMTDTLGVPAGLAGLAVLVPKIWDALFNPVVGGWSDRTNTRMGPRRPWMLAGAILLPPLFVLLFAAPAGLTPAQSAVWVAVAFLLSASAYTFFQVPYVSMPAEMTTDYAERTNIVSFRIVALTLGILFSGAVAPLLVDLGGDGRAGYTLMGAGVALFMAFGMFAAVVGTRRAPHSAVPSGAANLVVAIRAARGNRYFLPLWGCFVIQALAVAAMLATIPFFARYILDSDGAETLLFVALVAPAILVMPLWRRAGLRIGKTKGYLAASLCYITGAVGLALGLVLPTALVFLFVMAAGVGYAGMQLFPLAMLPDTVTVDEARSGERRSGMFTGLWAAGETAAFAAGPALVGALLAVTGFISSDADTVVDQPDSALLGIVLAISILPVVALGASLLLLRHYRLTEAVLVAETESKTLIEGGE